MFAQPNNVVIGHAAGVPFVALPPLRDRGPDAPIVLAWHLLDPPRTEAAFAAAVPLVGLDAWRVYLGLPMSGSRTVGGGHEEFMRLLFVDPVLNVHRPVAGGAIDEFAAAFDELRERLGVDGGPIGVMGGSMGGAVAQLAIIEGGLSVQAAVLINPVTRLHDTVDALAVHHGMSYTWTEPSSAFARRLDFVARSDELAALQHPPAILVITGEDDLDAAFRTPTAAFVTRLEQRGLTVDTHRVTGMAHSFAAEPGTEAAPQLPHAAEVDRVAAAWFAKHLKPSF